ncbi:hypothetical protein [Verminephrobacter aporrectodeae]|uniref:Uncharacterized protein n=3 Tax=Verminephrobacter TaxID=364316 RepID=A0ABT3KQ94_9BURK|nr:hypothetical protein [Verminephrobacter aporrectodeae]MCW5255508.1 hypothetical protein [Verminephrobacter aporrectodeae subsp. tuberculatae]MCW5320492.1 hypothetical protein [Verminephrobacter aporrectodeae subsp. tuberculatae]MCW8177332.1 hypothetical protein [Verminephrobacter aporrectodeae subsp. tuberculatae]MCW8204737.1 hypothetical protein [Verminephrobacter aporrectodeae subsp. tuberculatae]MCW8209050.1 hypothetical protein [Verminephrobacter aporrectodeae subsp. tuberculatae]
MSTSTIDFTSNLPGSPRITIDNSRPADEPAIISFTFDEPVTSVEGLTLGGPASGPTISHLNSPDGGRTWLGILPDANDTAASMLMLTGATVAPAAKAEEQVLADDQSSTDSKTEEDHDLSLADDQSSAGSESKVAQDTDDDKADEEQDDSMVLKSSTEATAAPAAKAEEQVLADDQSSTDSKAEEQDTDDYSMVWDDSWNGDKGYANVDDRDGNYYSDDYSNGGYNWDYNWDDASGAADVQPLLIVGRPSDADSYWF